MKKRRITLLDLQYKSFTNENVDKITEPHPKTYLLKLAIRLHFDSFFLKCLKRNQISKILEFLRVNISFADPGCISWFLSILDLGSRIQKQQQKRGLTKNLLSYLFCCHKYHNIENYLIFELAKKKIWSNLQRIIELFTQKIVIFNL